MKRTYRAAYWTDGQGELVLTAPEHASLSDEELLAEALEEADRIGLDLSYGYIEIGDWTDPLPHTEAEMMERWTVVEAAACDGGLQIARIEPWEDCCAAARRHGGICWHGAEAGGGGATFEECREAIEAEEARRLR